MPPEPVKALKPVADPTVEALRRLNENQIALERVERRTRPLVQRARKAGASWFDIGLALGVTPQAAHKRFRYDGP
jgi:hypothetical protein